MLWNAQSISHRKRLILHFPRVNKKPFYVGNTAIYKYICPANLRIFEQVSIDNTDDSTVVRILT
jgi:hypothetical protein